jgi:hypothetical protein
MLVRWRHGGVQELVGEPHRSARPRLQTSTATAWCVGRGVRPPEHRGDNPADPQLDAWRRFQRREMDGAMRASRHNRTRLLCWMASGGGRSRGAARSRLRWGPRCEHGRSCRALARLVPMRPRFRDRHRSSKRPGRAGIGGSERGHRSHRPALAGQLRRARVTGHCVGARPRGRLRGLSPPPAWLFVVGPRPDGIAAYPALAAPTAIAPPSNRWGSAAQSASSGTGCVPHPRLGGVGQAQLPRLLPGVLDTGYRWVRRTDCDPAGSPRQPQFVRDPLHHRTWPRRPASAV